MKVWAVRRKDRLKACSESPRYPPRSRAAWKQPLCPPHQKLHQSFALWRAKLKPPGTAKAAALDSHRSVNPVVNWACKGPRLCAPCENLMPDGRGVAGGDSTHCLPKSSRCSLLEVMGFGLAQPKLSIQLQRRPGFTPDLDTAPDDLFRSQGKSLSVGSVRGQGSKTPGPIQSSLGVLGNLWLNQS
ncbi:hypothetical protein AAY473_027215 [Plecturocebus cupreus]